LGRGRRGRRSTGSGCAASRTAAMARSSTSTISGTRLDRLAGPPSADPGRRPRPLRWLRMPEGSAIETIGSYAGLLAIPVLVALVVGLVLTAINQLDVILGGAATTATWIKCALNFVVPFVVSNLGLLSARGTTPEPTTPPGEAHGVRRRRGRQPFAVASQI